MASRALDCYREQKSIYAGVVDTIVQYLEHDEKRCQTNESLK